MVVHPKAMSNYAQARMQRAKTDKLDAVMILDYAQRMPFVAWQPPSERVLQLQAVMRRVDQLTQAIIREHSRAHAQGYHIGSTGLIARDMAVHIRHLKRRIPYLQAQALKLIEQDETLQHAYQRLCSVPGIAQKKRLANLGRGGTLARRYDTGPMGRTRRAGSQTETIRNRQPGQTHLESRQ